MPGAAGRRTSAGPAASPERPGRWWRQEWQALGDVGLPCVLVAPYESAVSLAGSHRIVMAGLQEILVDAHSWLPGRDCSVSPRQVRLLT
jgi:hypothetical protein